MLGRILGDLKRRNVIRVAGVYAVTAWGLFQIAKTVFETLGFPKWTSPFTLIALAAGLPIVMLLAWAFERSPDGAIRMARSVSRDTPSPPLSLLDGAILVGVIGVLALTGLQLGGVLSAPTLRGAPGMPDRSVAVLPFVSFSAEPGAGFFADGLTEEIIDSLAQNPDLKVAGRTSSFFYKGKNLDLREVGAKLGVGHVVEGSVRRDGDRLRVTAQLIKASDGYHLWSQTFDRQDGDAFAIQSEIAREVARELDVRLAPDRGDAREQDRDPAAYQLELTARAHLRDWGLENLRTAREQFARLMRLEPSNADARAGFAQATILLMQNYLDLDYDTAMREAQAAAAEALRVDPQSAAAHIAQASISYIRSRRGDDARYAREADAAFRRGLNIAPRNPDAMLLYGGFLAQQNRYTEALTQFRRALDIDPLNRVTQSAYADALAATGRFEEAERQYRAVIDVHPGFSEPQYRLGLMLVSRGQLAAAEPWLRAAADTGEDPSAILRLVMLYSNLGMPEDALKAAERMRGTPLGDSIADGIPLLIRGEFAPLLAHSQRQFAASGDPFWRSFAAHAAVMTGDFAEARRNLIAAAPALFTPEPKVAPDRISEALSAAAIARGQGDRAQERRLLRAALRAATPLPGVRDDHENRLLRVRAYAQLGERERALSELSAAAAAGWRNLYDTDLMRLERYPGMSGLREDPAFKALIGQVEADLARQRTQLLASRS